MAQERAVMGQDRAGISQNKAGMGQDRADIDLGEGWYHGPGERELVWARRELLSWYGL